MAVEAPAAMVIDRGCAGVIGDLETMDLVEAGPLGDGADPAVGGTAVEAAAVVAEQYRPRRVAFAAAG